MIITIIVILIVVFIVVNQKQKDGKDLSSFEKEVKNIGDKIVDGVSNVITVNVSKCPNCGAGVKSDTQKNCEYCGSKIPRERKFK